MVLELNSLLDRMSLVNKLIIMKSLKDKCSQNHMECKFLSLQHKRILMDKPNNL